MHEENWPWLIGLIIAIIFLWRKLSSDQSEPQPPEQTSEIVIPPPASAPEPEPEYKRGVQKKPVNRPSNPIRPPPPPPPNRGRVKTTSAAPVSFPKRKPWLRGEEREKWQREQSEKLAKLRQEESDFQKAAAQERSEEKKRQNEIEKAKAMAAAEARMAEASAKAAARANRSNEANEIERQRQDYIRQKVPYRIQRDMQRFLAGEFVGAELSPLTYVGYHVGTVAGLREGDRRERLEVCFRVPIPEILYADYKSWGEPATTQRLNAMMEHIRVQAAIRSSQSKYERAVSEWDADRKWLNSTLSQKAANLTVKWNGV